MRIVDANVYRNAKANAFVSKRSQSVFKRERLTQFALSATTLGRVQGPAQEAALMGVVGTSYTEIRTGNIFEFERAKRVSHAGRYGRAQIFRFTSPLS